MTFLVFTVRAEALGETLVSPGDLAVHADPVVGQAAGEFGTAVRNRCRDRCRRFAGSRILSMASSTASMLIEGFLAFDSRQATTRRASPVHHGRRSSSSLPRAALAHLTRGSTLAFAGHSSVIGRFDS
jgi:hypothetical protein